MHEEGVYTPIKTFKLDCTVCVNINTHMNIMFEYTLMEKLMQGPCGETFAQQCI